MTRTPKNSYTGTLLTKEETDQEYPLFDSYIQPKQYTGPNVRGETVTCWGIEGIDTKSGMYCFVRLNNPEEADRFRKEKI